ncbi:Uncharacterised protein [Raoultella terrigena]|uniref:Uncharacterized protein n=1 Tax=Raoultella terrigena TaxID=577 RepID=A0A4U9CZ40_RAOTE|nr:Uncharacterised protein [Raoultella terrigena]
MHLIAQALDKPDKIGVAEIAALVGTHHLVVYRVQRQRLGSHNTAVSKSADRLRAAAYRLSDFCHGVAAEQAELAASASRAITVFFIDYQRGIDVVTSPFCAR